MFSSFLVADEHVTSCYVAISIMTSLVVGLAFLARCTIKYNEESPNYKSDQKERS